MFYIVKMVFSRCTNKFYSTLKNFIPSTITIYINGNSVHNFVSLLIILWIIRDVLTIDSFESLSVYLASP